MIGHLCAACGETCVEDPCDVCGESALLVDRYRLIEIVGEGATGTTYRAHVLNTERADADPEHVAVKEMPLGRAGVDLRRFERESQVLRQLRHDRIPAYVDHFTEGKGKRRTLYLVQAFIDGPTLAEELKSRRYTEDEVLEILTSVCDVLTYLHTLQPPVIHRDLKPGNLVRRGNGDLVLIDFGAVRDVLRDPALGGSTVAGTYGYMAPEQFSGDASPATDLYALGVLAVALLSRRDPLDLMKGHRLDWQAVVHASAPTKALIEALLAPLPLDRPDSATAVQRRIAGILRGDVESASGTDLVATTTTLPTVLRPAKQRSTAVLLAFVGCLFGLHNWYLRRWVRAMGSAIFSWTLVPAALSLYDGFKMLTQGEAAFDTRYNPEHVAVERARAEDVMRQIEQLHALREKGALTESEFRDQKARLLGRGGGIFDRLSAQLGGQLTDIVDQLQGLPNQLMDSHHGRLDGWLNRSIERQEKRHARRQQRRDARRDRRDRRDRR